MVQRLKIDISKKNPYDAVADYVVERGLSNGCADAYVVCIKTSVLGESVELLYNDGPDWTIPVWTWQNDWYEGGDVELIGFIAIDNIIGDKQHTANWIDCRGDSNA